MISDPTPISTLRYAEFRGDLQL